MNNLPILLAPIYALFSKEFYRRVLAARLSRGFLYLLYVTGMVITVFFVLAMTQGMPQVDQFVEWVKKEMPPLTWTADGLQMKVESPYAMVHPQFGPLATFDMTVTEADADKIGNFPVYVTAKKVYVRQQVNDLRVIDLVPPASTPAAAEVPANVPQSVQITGEIVDRIYQQAKPWVIAIIFVSFTIIFYVMTVIQGLICSLVGLIFNRFRNSKLSYGAILNASFFAMTATFILEILRAVIPVLSAIPGGFLVNLLLTSVYLFLAIKLTEEKATDNAGTGPAV
jgi:hypothetical protein